LKAQKKKRESESLNQRDMFDDDVDADFDKLLLKAKAYNEVHEKMIEAEA